MTDSKIGILVLLWLLFIRGKHSQLTAVVTPRGYNASLDPEASFTFQCNVTGTNNIQWFVDGSPPSAQEIRDRGISESGTITMDDSVRRSLSISRNSANSNITILCLANVLPPTSGVITSDPVLFKIQGLLDAPSNLMLSEADNQHMRRLSWDKPFSLDITDVDPDIECFNVCYSLVNVSAEKSQCTCVNQTEYTLLNVNIPLLFIVSAVNIVGVGNSSTILHEAINCNATNYHGPSITNIQSLVSFSISGTNPVIKFLFQQLLTDTEETCYFVYRIETSPTLAPNMTDQGIQIPSIVNNYSQTKVQLSLTVDTELLVNEEYCAIFGAVNANGEVNSSNTIKFDTYDVQLVNGTVLPQDGGVELSCTFAEGSRAQSCILSICRMEDDIEEPCRNITINREENTVNQQIINLQPGLYIIGEVAEVESDGQLTVHRKKNVLELRVNEPPYLGSSSESVINIVLISVGSAVAFIAVSLVLVIVVVVYIRKKLFQRVVPDQKDHMSDHGTGMYI